MFHDDPYNATLAIEKRPGIQAMFAEPAVLSIHSTRSIVAEVTRFSRKVHDILAIYSGLSKVDVDVHVVPGRETPKRHRSRKQPKSE